MEHIDWEERQRTVLQEQRLYSEVHHVPILRSSEVPLFCSLVEQFRPQRVLEIGTAIGYSTLLLAEHMHPAGTVVSMERDASRYAVAQSFIASSPFASRITLQEGDASALIGQLEGLFDFIFLDGAKGHYLSQLQELLPHLAPEAVVVADNVLFRGYVEHPEHTPRRYRTMVQRLRAYLEFVQTESLFSTTIYPLGDGMSVSIWKGFHAFKSGTSSASWKP